VTHVSVAATAAYLPEHVMTAAELSTRTGIPEPVIVEKFGLHRKHIAADGEHASDLSVRAAGTLLEEAGVDPESIDVVMYFGSMWKDYALWQAAPVYQVVAESGPDHDKQFIVGVYIKEALVAEGQGKSKQEAEQEAARAALEAKGW